MLKKYNKMSKKIDEKGPLKQYDVNYINNCTKKYFNHIFTEEEILAIAFGVAIGRVKSVDDYPLFNKIIKMQPDLKEDLTNLLKYIILASSNYNFNIYKNASLAYSFKSNYNKLNEKQKEYLSNKSVKVSNPKNNNGNISYALYRNYNIFLKNIFNSERKYDIKTLNYYIDYSKIYFGNCNNILTILQKLYSKVKITKYSTNQLYDLFKSYLEKIRKDINENHYDSFEEFNNIYLKLRGVDLGTFNEEITQLHNYALNKNLLLLIKDVFNHKKTLNQICGELGKNKNDLLNELKEIDLEIYIKLIELEENSKTQDRQNKESKYNYFINNMKIVSNFIKGENFIPIYYYSLTEVNINEMILKLGNNGQIDLMNYLNNAYYSNQELYDKVKMIQFKEEIGDKGINEIAKIIKEEKLPKCYGVISYLVNLYNDGTLNEFKKDNVKRLILNEEKRK